MKKILQRGLLFLLCVFIMSTALSPAALAADPAEFYANGSDCYTWGAKEFEIDPDRQDGLWVTEGGEERLLFASGVITMVGRGGDLFFLAYRDGISVLYRLACASERISELYTCASLSVSMAMSGDRLFLAEGDGIRVIHPGNGDREMLNTARNVSVLYFSDSTHLRYYTETDGAVTGWTYDVAAGIARKDPDKRAANYYVPRLTAPDRTDPYYTTLNIFHLCGYGMTTNNGNCTCYAFGRSYENLGTQPRLSWGNAGEWYDDNKASGNYQYGKTPALGAVAVWKKPGGAGHVAVVEVIDGDTVITSESGWQSFYFRTKVRSASDPNFSASSKYTFDGFIYVLGTGMVMEPTLAQTAPSDLGTEVPAFLENLGNGRFLSERDGKIGAEEQDGAIGQVWDLKRMDSGAYTIQNHLSKHYLRWEDGTGVYLATDAQEFFAYAIEDVIYFCPARSAGTQLLCCTESGVGMMKFEGFDPSAAFCLIDLTDCLSCLENLHSFQTRAVEPGCETEGYTSAVCSLCGTEYRYHKKAALGHDWDYGELVKAPSLLNGGTIRYTCVRCGETNDLLIERLVCFGDESCPGRKFKDMPPAGNWAHPAIDYCLEHGFFSGTSEDQFIPWGSMTRAMLVSVIYRLEGRPDYAGTASFADVPAGSWFEACVLWAAENGIVSGVGNGMFDPNGAVTREQIAVILHNYARWKGLSNASRGYLSGFADEEDVSGWALNAISWSVAEGLISGTPENNLLYLRPKAPATRAQVASIIGRFYVAFVDDGGT